MDTLLADPMFAAFCYFSVGILSGYFLNVFLVPKYTTVAITPREIHLERLNVIKIIPKAVAAWDGIINTNKTRIINQFTNFNLNIDTKSYAMLRKQFSMEGYPLEYFQCFEKAMAAGLVKYRYRPLKRL